MRNRNHIKIQKPALSVEKSLNVLKVNVLKGKNIVNSEIIVIIQVNIELQYVIYKIVYLTKLPQFSITDQNLVVIKS